MQVEVLELVTALVTTDDADAQRFVVEQVRRAGNSPAAGWMAYALLGEAGGGPVDLKKKLGLSPARPEVIRELEALLPTASGWSLLSAAVAAVLRADRERAVEIFTPFLSAGPDLDAATLERLDRITAWAMFDGAPLRPLIELVVRTAVRLDNQRINNNLSYLCLNEAPEWAAELAHLLELDLPPALIYRLVREAVTGNTTKVNARRRKRLLPLFQGAAARVREDPSARTRLEEAEKALELPGALLSTKPPKAPKPPPRVALKRGAATEGGPVLALPAEVVAEWGGVLLPNGKPGEGDFAGTDYGRACSVSTWRTPWGSYGFVDVGELKGLVLGDACETAKLKDGTFLVVMQGDGEEVAALLKEEKPWKKLDGTFNLPSGKFVLFDSAHEKGKTADRSTVALAPGKYALDEYVQDDDRHLWIVRLTRVESAR